MSRPRHLEHVPLLDALDDEAAGGLGLDDGAAGLGFVDNAEGVAQDSTPADDAAKYHDDWYDAGCLEEEQEIGHEGINEDASWVEAVTDEDELVRNTAVEELMKQESSESAPIVAEIGELLKKSEDPDLQQAAADALCKLGQAAAPALPSLLAWISDEAVAEQDEWSRDSVRLSVTSALGCMGASAAASVPQLAHLLASSNPLARLAAAQALGKMGEVAVPAVQDLSKALTDEDENVRHSAAEAIGSIGVAASQAIPDLVKATREDCQPEVRARAVTSLGSMGPDVEPRVLDIAGALEDEDWEVRKAALRTVSKCGAAASPTCHVIASLLSDPDAPSSVQEAASTALGNLGPHAAEVVPHLISLLKHEKVRVRIEAVKALGNMGLADATVLADIVHLLQDRNEYVQSAAAEMIGQLGKSAVPALPQILGLLESRDAGVRKGAAQTLGELRASALHCTPKLLPLLTDPDERVRRQAAVALGCIASQAVSVSPTGSDAEVAGVGRALARAMVDDAGAVNETAAEALSSLGVAAAEALPDVVRLLSNADPTIRMWALWTLGKLGEVSAPVVPHMTKALQEAKEDYFGPEWRCVAWAAMEALAKVGALQPMSVVVALPALIPCLRDEDPYTRQRALKAIGSMGPAGKEGAVHIAKLLQDDDFSVQEAAQEALSKVDHEGESPV